MGVRMLPMKLWRPRFSIRTLTIFVTLVCAYFGAWEATKKYGVDKKPEFPVREQLFIESHSPAPLLVSTHVMESVPPVPETAQKIAPSSGWHEVRMVESRKYYLWLFGPRLKLPFEAEVR
jgi:hypothetical protein